MEVHSPVIAKRLWNFLRIAFFMMRKGLISKRKLIMDINLMMKRGKVIGKSIGKNLMFHHSRNATRGFGLQEYEFSCSNSPSPVFFHVAKRKHKNFPSIPHFPCIHAQEDPDETLDPSAAIVLPKIEYSPKIECSPEYSYNFRFDMSDLTVGEKMSPIVSPFSVRVSNYSQEDGINGESRQVDNEAEEFIRMFYEQLRAQSRTQLLEYQEMQYQEMLARGTR
ncbi:uncharacterized protein LOC143861671 [Tasmannia lanceolata]|uniref:uncharacterized protein LOC143861671 n=1 Tax=Tasmannia lanceolata TaxID=3420 RepID=UPI004062C134